MINIGVIGCGHWGPNHIRNFSNLGESAVSICCDKNQERLAVLKKSYPNLKFTSDYMEILKDKDIQAVIVATPTSTHYKVVKECLEYDKDILCEKPLTQNVAEAEELAELVKVKERILLVGHVFLFNTGIQKLREYIQNDTLGKVYYIHSTRTNLGPIRDDANVVWDLASHDVAIFDYLLNSHPLEATAKGAFFLQKEIEDVAFISLTYPNRILANIHVSWLDPRKVREITIVGNKKMAIWNDLVSDTGPIRIYDKGVIWEPYYQDFGEFKLLVQDGDITIPKINLGEPLKHQARHFINCVETRTKPISDCQFALNVVRSLDAIQSSMKMGGSPQILTNSKS